MYFILRESVHQLQRPERGSIDRVYRGSPLLGHWMAGKDQRRVACLELGVSGDFGVGQFYLSHIGVVSLTVHVICFTVASEGKSQWIGWAGVLAK
jgi:hypothetical protein